eukprot:scaffold3753_cov127-Isochrysis_galbana.AAC.1
MPGSPIASPQTRRRRLLLGAGGVERTFHRRRRGARPKPPRRAHDPTAAKSNSTIQLGQPPGSPASAQARRLAQRASGGPPHARRRNKSPDQTATPSPAAGVRWGAPAGAPARNRHRGAAAQPSRTEPGCFFRAAARGRRRLASATAELPCAACVAAPPGRRASETPAAVQRRSFPQVGAIDVLIVGLPVGRELREEPDVQTVRRVRRTHEKEVAARPAEPQRPEHVERRQAKEPQLAGHTDGAARLAPLMRAVVLRPVGSHRRAPVAQQAVRGRRRHFSGHCFVRFHFRAVLFIYEN